MDTMIGHNHPPTLAEEISARHVDLVADIDAIVSTDLPMVIVSDDAAAQVSTVGKDATALVVKLNATHKAEKEPHLTAGREVDAWKNALAAKLTEFLNDCKALVGAWQDKKEAEERAARKAQADRLAAEAERAAQEAMKAMTPAVMERAAEAAEAAQAAEQAVTVKTADVARVAVGGRAVASRSARWTYEVVSIDAVPRQYLTINDAAVKAAIAGANGKRDIPGLRIFEAKSTSFR